jgi:SAM-dependent methyltransferase
MRCARCEFGFSDPFVAGTTDFYALSAVRDGYPSDKWEFDKTIESLEQLDLDGGNILEIGAGAGLFLAKIAPKRVPPANITAIDYNPRSVSKLEEAGYRALLGDFRQVLDFPGRYRAIFLFQVLEHMDDPHGVFSSLHLLLEPGGHLFIAVPNPHRIDFNESSASLNDMPPNHIGRWRRESFDRIAQTHGFNVEEVALEPFSLQRFISMDIGYYYLQMAQKEGTLAEWSRSLRSTRAGKALMFVTGAMYAPARVPLWLAAGSRLQGLGNSLWVHLSKAPRTAASTNQPAQTTATPAGMVS